MLQVAFGYLCRALRGGILPDPHGYQLVAVDLMTPSFNFETLILPVMKLFLFRIHLEYLVLLSLETVNVPYVISHVEVYLFLQFDPFIFSDSFIEYYSYCN